MKRKVFLMLIVALLAIATVAVFAACNDSIQSGDGASGNSPVIDVPFVPVTEGTEGLQFELFDETSWEAGLGIDISGYWVTGYTGDETDVVIPNMHEGKRVIGIMNGAFYRNYLIASVNISNGIKYLGIARIAELGAVFYDCTNLKSVTLPQSLTNIDAFMFENCPSITTVTIPANVSEITINPFINCENLTEVKVSKDNGNYYSDSKYLYEKKTNKIVSAFNVGSSVTIPASVTRIGDWAFSDCDSLASVTIPDSVTSIGNYAFYGCTSLTSVTIPDSVTSIGSDAFYNTPFYNNISNGEVYLGKVLYEYKGNMPANYSVIIKEGTVSISPRAFYGCDSLTSITIPDSVTSIGDGAFYNCTSLTSVTIPDSVTSIGRNGFSDCTSLTSVTIPDSVTSIGEYAFRGCDSLETITVDSGNSVYHSAGNCLIETATKTLIAGCKNSVIPNDGSVTNIGHYAFMDCTSLTSVIIPDSVTSIGYWAFYNCTSLASVTIGNSVTSIGERAFINCDLLSVTIPNSVTSIGDYAFSGCDSLTSVNFEGTVAQWNAISKGSDWNYDTPFTKVVCSDGTVSVG